MSVGRSCRRMLATASPDDSVRAAARRMAAYGVGEVVVLDVDRHARAVGIVTDRDITIRCVAGKLDPDQTRVSDVMTTRVHAVSEHVSMEEALARMAAAGTRRVVVTNDADAAIGVLSLDDVLALFVEEMAAVGDLLERQRPRIPT